MKLTAWEAMKVVGNIVKELGVKAEAYEDETGEDYKMTKEDAVNIGLELVTKLGVEILD